MKRRIGRPSLPAIEKRALAEYDAGRLKEAKRLANRSSWRSLLIQACLDSEIMDNGVFSIINKIDELKGKK